MGLTADELNEVLATVPWGYKTTPRMKDAVQNLFERATPPRDSSTAWDFYATVAGVGVAFMTIVDTVPETEQETLCHAIANELDSWRPHGYAALVDFTNAVHRFEARGVETPLAL